MGESTVYSSAWSATAKHQLCGLNNGNYFLIAPGAGKINILPGFRCWGELSSLFLTYSSFLPDVHRAFPSDACRGPEGEWKSLPPEGHHFYQTGLHPMTSLNFNCFLKVLSPNTVSLGAGASTHGFGEDIIQSVTGRYPAAEAQDTCLGIEHRGTQWNWKGWTAPGNSQIQACCSKSAR